MTTIPIVIIVTNTATADIINITTTTITKTTTTMEDIITIIHLGLDWVEEEDIIMIQDIMLRRRHHRGLVGVVVEGAIMIREMVDGEEAIMIQVEEIMVVAAIVTEVIIDCFLIDLKKILISFLTVLLHLKSLMSTVASHANPVADPKFIVNCSS